MKNSTYIIAFAFVVVVAVAVTLYFTLPQTSSTIGASKSLKALKTYVLSPSIFNTNIYATLNTTNNVVYPEFCKENLYGNEIPDVNNIALALSGGGSRAFNACIGHFRAFNELNLLTKLSYVSTNSGGGLFYGCFSFAKQKYDINTLLGEIIKDPSLLTIQKLSEKKANSMCNVFVNTNLNTYIFEAITNKSIKLDDGWSYCMGKMVLEPYGLNSDCTIALNKAHADDLMSRNVMTLPPIYLKDNDPFWISNNTLMFTYTNDSYPNIVVPFTPLYAGIGQNIEKFGNKIGGAFIETFAFGNTDVPSESISSFNDTCNNMSNVALNKISNMSYLRDVIGVSSSAYAFALYKNDYLNSTVKAILPSNAVDLIPTYNIFGTKPLAMTTSDSQCTINTSLTCNVPNGFDSNSCKTTSVGCRSITAPQCTSDSQCTRKLSRFGVCSNIDPSKSNLSCVSNASWRSPLACKCVPFTNEYKPSTNKALTLQKSKIGDGAFADNLAILSLVARGCKKIIALNSTGVDINDVNATCSIQCLFGVCKDPDCGQVGCLATNSVQIFNSSDWADVSKQCTDRYKSGDVVYSKSRLQVIPNVLNGVKGGYYVDIVIFNLQPCKKFVDLLPKETQDILKSIQFPMYDTFFPSTKTSFMILNQIQANLLSHYTYWSTMQNDFKNAISSL